MGKFAVKLVAHLVVITAMLLVLSTATIWGALVTALAIGVISYLVGDLLILRASQNNIVSTLCDAVLVFLMLWAVRASNLWSLSYTDMLVITIVAGIFEYFYHMWLLSDDRSARRQRA